MSRAFFDFETEAIDKRPAYPPRPVGVAVKIPGKKDRYYAWGHPTKNGIWEKTGSKTRLVQGDAKRLGVLALREVYSHDEIGGQNIAKFDFDVAETHLGVKPPAWHKVRDSLFSRFLVDPHAPTLSLKPSAERVLGIAPEERDQVYDWLAEQGHIQRPRTVDGKLKYAREAGAHIGKAPGDLVGLYAMQDNELAKSISQHDEKIIKRDGMWDAYVREHRVAPILLANERQGMRIDLERLGTDLPVYEAALLRCDSWLRKRLKMPASANLDSDAELAGYLRKAGVVKHFPQTPTGKDSVSKNNLTKRFFEDPDVYRALCYRNILAYVLSQNLRPWFQENHEGYVFTQWHQVRSASEQGGGARSGRITCAKWQNLIKNPLSGMNPDYVEADDTKIRKILKLPELPRARKYCLPDKGDLWGHADFNQEELRLLAHYEDGRLAKAYRDDPKTDVHALVQGWMHELTPKRYEREPTKRANFQTAYGGGAPALSRKTGMTLEESKEFLSIWKKAMPDVVRLNKALMAMYQRGEPIRTFGGRLYRCKPPTIATKGDKKGQLIFFDYTALNYLMQPSAADILKMVLIAYDEHPKRKSRMINVVHDEDNISSPAKIAKQQLEVLAECMLSVKLDVPMVVDRDVRPNWGEKVK